jgi:hypothetical protein
LLCTRFACPSAGRPWLAWSVHSLEVDKEK